MSQDYVHPLQALRAVMVQKRRKLAESLLRSRKGAKAAKQCKKLIKLQRDGKGIGTDAALHMAHA